jgi:hypothetical protein
VGKRNEKKKGGGGNEEEVKERVKIVKIGRKNGDKNWEVE